MLKSVDKITDIMQVRGYFHKLHLMFAVSENFKDISRRLRHFGNMGEGMLRIAERSQGFVSLLYIGINALVLFYFILLSFRFGYSLPIRCLLFSFVKELYVSAKILNRSRIYDIILSNAFIRRRKK